MIFIINNGAVLIKLSYLIVIPVQPIKTQQLPSLMVNFLY